MSWDFPILLKCIIQTDLADGYVFASIVHLRGMAKKWTNRSIVQLEWHRSLQIAAVDHNLSQSCDKSTIPYKSRLLKFEVSCHILRI